MDGCFGWMEDTIPASTQLTDVVSRALRGGRGKEEPLSAIAMELQEAPGDDDLPPPVPLGTPPLGVGILLANQDTELTQNHSGRKAASLLNVGRLEPGGDVSAPDSGMQSSLPNAAKGYPRREPRLRPRKKSVGRCVRCSPLLARSSCCRPHACGAPASPR